MAEVRIAGDRICLGSGVKVRFQRTLRIPDDGKDYPLPPGFGCFPVRRVDDFADRVPAEWREQGGVFLPMYQREAMWIAFEGQAWKPRAVKVGIGKVCAITGTRWNESLNASPQDYLVTPPQPWLDGICVRKGIIRQFVAMPLGTGATVEGQITGEERFGGVQLKAFEPKEGRFPDEPPRSFGAPRGFGPPMAAPASVCRTRSPGPGSMGLAAGGRMKQSIYPDPHGKDTWDESRSARVFVHIVNSELYREITGESPPPSPITAREYERCGLPWFDLYDDALGALEGESALAKIKSVKELDGERFAAPQQDDGSVKVGPVKKLWTKVAKGLVRDGDW